MPKFRQLPRYLKKNPQVMALFKEHSLTVESPTEAINDLDNPNEEAIKKA